MRVRSCGELHVAVSQDSLYAMDVDAGGKCAHSPLPTPRATLRGAEPSGDQLPRFSFARRGRPLCRVRIVRAADDNEALAQVHILPPKAEQFTFAHPGVDGSCEEMRPALGKSDLSSAH